LGVSCTPTKGRQQDKQDEDAKRDDDIFEDAVRPEALAAIQFAFVFCVDLLLDFFVHYASLSGRPAFVPGL
jgi:hypothetical protein